MGDVRAGERDARAIRGEVELLADDDRPGGWLVLVDRVRQSYVDLDDPTYLDFDYTQHFAYVLDALAPGPLAVTHVGGGGLTMARYLATVRPGSPQIVLEPDAELTATVRTRLPLPRGARVRVRAVDGRRGMAALHDRSADAVILDAFHGARVPGELATTEFVADVARVLRPTGVLMVNIGDGAPLTFSRRLAVTIRAHLPQALVAADTAVLKGRRFGNLVMAAARVGLPIEQITRTVAGGPFPYRVLSGRALDSWTTGSTVITDAEPARSPEPPANSWRFED